MQTKYRFSNIRLGKTNHVEKRQKTNKKSPGIVVPGKYLQKTTLTGFVRTQTNFSYLVVKSPTFSAYPAGGAFLFPIRSSTSICILKVNKTIRQFTAISGDKLCAICNVKNRLVFTKKRQTQDRKISPSRRRENGFTF